MSERFFLSEEEIENRYGKPIIIISEMWTYSDIYYDSENDQFIEERYHEEYLDTGTVCDGCYVIPDGYLWKELVRTCNEEGMSAFLKYRNHIPEPLEIGKTITENDFCEGIYTLKQEDPWRRYDCRDIGSITVILDEANTVLGILGRAENYYFYFDPTSDVKKKGFQLWEEALATALDKVTFYHKNRVEQDGKNAKHKENDVVKHSTKMPNEKKGWLTKFLYK